MLNGEIFAVFLADCLLWGKVFYMEFVEDDKMPFIFVAWSYNKHAPTSPSGEIHED